MNKEEQSFAEAATYSGEHTPGSSGEVVVKWLMDRLALRTDASFELVDLRHLSIPFFDAPISPAQGVIVPGTEAWSARVQRADGFIFITPELITAIRRF